MDERLPAGVVKPQKALMRRRDPSWRPGTDDACAILYANGDFVLQRGPEPDGSPGHTETDVVDGPWAGFEEEVYDSFEMVPWHRHVRDIKAICVRDPIAPRSTAHWFEDFSQLAEADLSLLDYSGTTSMEYMFYRCSSLASLDVSGWDTSHVESMVWMFMQCASLASLDLSGWDVSGVRRICYMFYGCKSLASLDLSGWDTSHVEDMQGVFCDCTSLASLDLSGWDTSHAEYMSGMFCHCSSLASLDLAGWDVSGVRHMKDMFNGCSSLASLDLSGWDVSHAEYMTGLFSGCSSLTSLDLSSWDLSNLHKANPDLDIKTIEGWIRDLPGDCLMFEGCTSLVTLYVGKAFKVRRRRRSMGLSKGVRILRKEGSGTTRRRWPWSRMS